MERAVASLKWKTTASAACIPRRDSTTPSLWPLPFPDGLENSLQFVLGGEWADYLGVFSATRLLAVHPCSFAFLRTTSTFRHRASYPCLPMSPVLGASSTLQAGGGDKVAVPACS